MKKFIFLLFILLGIFFIYGSFTFAQSREVELYFFYGEGCPHCAKAKPYLDSLKEKYPGLKIYQYEVWQDPVNQELFQKMAEAYNEQPQGVPTVFIGDKVIVGYDESMDDQYIQAIDYCLKNNCPSPGEKLNGVTGNLSNDSSGQAQKQQASQNSTQQPQVSQNSQQLFWLIIGFVFLLFAGFILFPRKKN